MVPIEDLSFFQCYRRVIESYRLPPEQSETQLAAILRRVQAAFPPADRQGGRTKLHSEGANV